MTSNIDLDLQQLSDLFIEHVGHTSIWFPLMTRVDLTLSDWLELALGFIGKLS